MAKWEATLPDQWEAETGELVVCSLFGKYFWSYTIYPYISHELGYDEKVIAQGECDDFEEAKWKAIRARERFLVKQEIWAEEMEALITESLEASG